jgi:hypothetical protein
LLAQRQRLVIVAIVTTPLLQVVTAALLALETVRRGVTQGAVSAAFGVGGLILLALLSQTNALALGLMGVATMGTGVALGAVIRWAGNLVLSFQVVWLVCFVAVLAFGVFGPDPVALFGPLLKDFEAALAAQPGSEAEAAEVVAQMAQIVPVAGALVVLGTLLLAYWLVTVASGEVRFAIEYRQLKLGRWLGSTAVIVLAFRLVFDTPLVQNLLVLAALGCMVQGLAVAHTWVYAKKWHPALLVVLYVLLVSPLATVVSIVGLVDNWVDLRKPARSAA